MFLRKQKLLKDSIVLYLKKQTRWTRTRAAIKTKETFFFMFQLSREKFSNVFQCHPASYKKTDGQSVTKFIWDLLKQDKDHDTSALRSLTPHIFSSFFLQTGKIIPAFSSYRGSGTISSVSISAKQLLDWVFDFCILFEQLIRKCC